MGNKATVITINVQKGGVGKTTTAHELAANLTGLGYKVLAIDLDQQMNLSRCSGAELTGYYTIYDVLKDKMDIEDSIQNGNNYDVAPAHKRFEFADKEFSSFEDVYRLTDAIEPVKGKYDFIILDTPPNLGILPSMALTAADWIVIPFEASPSGLQGLGQLYGKIDAVKDPKRGTNPGLQVAGILLTMYEYRTTVAQGIVNQLKEGIAKTKEIDIFETFIRRGTAVKQSQAWKRCLNEHEPNSNPAEDYRNFTKELLNKIQKGAK